MFGKYILFGLLAIFVCQTTIEANIINERSLLSQIEDLIKKLAGVIQTAVDKGLDTLKKVISTVSSSASNAIQIAEDTIKNVVQTAVNEILEWKEKAENLAVDVTDCIGDNIETLEKMPEETFTEFNECVSVNMKRITDIFDETVITIKKYFNLVDDKIKEVEQCGTGFNAITCYLGIIKDIGLLLTKIPLTVAKVVADSVQTILGVGKDISTCVADTVVQVTATISATSIETVTCIKEKIQLKEAIIYRL